MGLGGGLLAGVVGLRAMEQQVAERQAYGIRERPAWWPRWHATAAPVGILAVTLLLVWLAEPSQWRLADILDLASRRVELGALGYALAVVLAEGGVDMIFWALERQQRRMEERRARQEQLRNEGRAALATELREMVQGGVTGEEMLERLSREVEASGNGAKGK